MAGFGASWLLQIEGGVNQRNKRRQSSNIQTENTHYTSRIERYRVEVAIVRVHIGVKGYAKYSLAGLNPE